MEIPISEAKGRLTDLVRRAEAGDEVILTRHGQPAAKLVRARRIPTDPAERVAIIDRIVRSALNLSGEQFLADLDAGKFDDVDPDAHPGLLDVLMALPLVR